MTDQPRLRRAFAGLASGHAPAADPLGVVAAAGRLRRRRAVATSGAALWVAALLGGVVALRPVPDRGTDVVAQSTESPSETSQPSSEPPETAPPSPTPPPATPDATEAPAPPTVPPPSEPATPSPTPTPGPATWAPPGMTLTVDVAPADAATGQDVTISARVTDTDGFWSGGRVEYGDGSATPLPHWVAGCVPPRPGEEPDRTPQPSDETKTFHHAYAKAGTYTVKVVADTSRLCSPGHPVESMTKSAEVRVTGEDMPSNGPAQPRASILDPEGDFLAVAFTIAGSDADGVASAYSLDFGDGSAPLTGELWSGGCPPPGESGYPSGGGRQDVTHEYATAGTYTVTLTVTSTGCDGEHPQTGTATWTAEPYDPPPA